MDILCEMLAYPLPECIRMWMWIFSSGWNWKCSIFSSYVPREPTKHARPLTMLPQRGVERAMKSERQIGKRGGVWGQQNPPTAVAIKMIFFLDCGCDQNRLWHAARQADTDRLALPSPGPEQAENTDTSVNEVATRWACHPLLSFGQVLSATVYGSANRHWTQSGDLSIAKSFHAPDEC